MFHVTSTHRKKENNEGKKKTRLKTKTTLQAEMHQNKHNAYEQPTAYSAQSIVYKKNACNCA